MTLRLNLRLFAFSNNDYFDEIQLQHFTNQVIELIDTKLKKIFSNIYFANLLKQVKNKDKTQNIEN